MNILTSELYEEQLKGIFELLAKDDFKMAKNFKMYLDTIIINIATKGLICLFVHQHIFTTGRT